MVAIQRGTERPNDVVIIQGHIDSRVTDVMNFTSDAPGANDDGSGVAAVMEAARVLSKHKFPGTIVYAALSGEEQGLYGGKVLANYAKAQGWNVVTDPQQRHHRQQLLVRRRVRFDACARAVGRAALAGRRRSLPAATHSLGGENDAPSRNISRYPRQPRRPAEDRARRPPDLAHRPLRPRRRSHPVPRARLSRRAAQRRDRELQLAAPGPADRERQPLRRHDRPRRFPVSRQDDQAERRRARRDRQRPAAAGAEGRRRGEHGHDADLGVR